MGIPPSVIWEIHRFVADMTILECSIAVVALAHVLLSITDSLLMFGDPSEPSFVRRFWPQYNFFTSTDGISSIQVRYRDRLCSGEYTDWKPITDTAYSHSWLNIVWAPHRRTQKTLDTTVYRLLTFINTQYEWPNDQMRDLSTLDESISHMSYSMLTKFVRSHPHHIEADYTQFQLTMHVRSHESPIRMLQSQHIPLEPSEQ